jgi:transposase
MKSKKNILSKENEVFIRKNCMKLTVKQIVEHTKLSIGKVRSFIAREGLEYKLGSTGDSKRLSEEEVDYIAKNYQTQTNPQIAKHLGISRKRVSYICGKYRFIKTKTVAEKIRKLKPLPKFIVPQIKTRAESKERKYIKPQGIIKGSRMDMIHQPIKKYNSIF